MNIVQTVLVFVVIPAAFIAAVFAIVYGPAELKHASRYRPGRAWSYPPIWYLPHPVEGTAHGDEVLAIEAGHTSTTAELVEAVGGASGEW
ncbi:hypothetical protein SAMN05892883_2172 [Jatrophihabitans sp. GAS493]|uniref:aa3-type cytochrome oxidase subunit CtaJ n=1 Tax=Jatrophihabitans sp. GAS493 TaxID=1907575 RepID=UPI000BB82514|nr:hypothetical protein [Jatrophihabitans sp. GAS493]SOD72845.1 hypothetical protein SAMN05892883_2172 [Jatrophihabitans sp. GAS493]